MRSSTAVVGLLLPLLLAASAGIAAAAVRVCTTAQLGDMAHGASELEARRAALTSWRAKAARSGRAFTSWRLAVKKSSRCAKLKDGRHACVVFAVPCRVSQVAPRKHRPEGLKPQPPAGRLPGKSGVRDI